MSYISRVLEEGYGMWNVECGEIARLRDWLGSGASCLQDFRLSNKTCRIVEIFVVSCVSTKVKKSGKYRKVICGKANNVRIEDSCIFSMFTRKWRERKKH
jgi:hypothetical protein